MNVLSILGLSSYLQDAQTIISVTKDGYEAIKAAKEMLDSPEGERFKSAIRAAIDAAEHKSVIHPVIEHPAGKYEWDMFQGWVWIPAEN